MVKYFVPSKSYQTSEFEPFAINGTTSIISVLPKFELSDTTNIYSSSAAKGILLVKSAVTIDITTSETSFCVSTIFHFLETGVKVVVDPLKFTLWATSDEVLKLPFVLPHIKKSKLVAKLFVLAMFVSATSPNPIATILLGLALLDCF